MVDRRILASVACMLFAIALLGGCSQGATISGTVYAYDSDTDQTYKVIQGAAVRLLKASTSVDADVTDSTGGYLFENVAAGTYSVKATYTLGNMSFAYGGYGWSDGRDWSVLTISGSSPTYSLTYTGVTVVAGDAVTVNFGLQGY